MDFITFQRKVALAMKKAKAAIPHESGKEVLGAAVEAGDITLVKHTLNDKGRVSKTEILCGPVPCADGPEMIEDYAEWAEQEYRLNDE